MRTGLIDEYVLVTAPVLVGGGTPFFTALDNWVHLTLVETRAFPDGVLLYQVRDQALSADVRRRPESNRCARLCRPLRSHSATAPGARTS